MAAIIHDIRDSRLPLPDFLVLDASLLLELRPDLTNNRPNHLVAINFLDKLSNAAKTGETIPLLPLLAFEECYFKLCVGILTQYSKNTSQNWHDYYKNNPKAINAVVPLLINFKQILDAFPIEIIEPEDLAVPPRGKLQLMADRMGEFIGSFSVLPKDATILCDAERLGVFNVATLDGDWKRADGFNVYTIP
jgi:predicted nucleic acid-binding protein